MYTFCCFVIGARHVGHICSGSACAHVSHMFKWVHGSKRMAFRLSIQMIQFNSSTASSNASCACAVSFFELLIRSSNCSTLTLIRFFVWCSRDSVGWSSRLRFFVCLSCNVLVGGRIDVTLLSLSTSIIGTERSERRLLFSERRLLISERREATSASSYWVVLLSDEEEEE